MSEEGRSLVDDLVEAGNRLNLGLFSLEGRDGKSLAAELIEAGEEFLQTRDGRLNLTDAIRAVARSVHENFTTPNECDRNLEPANVVDGLFSISRALHHVARAIEGHATASQAEPARPITIKTFDQVAAGIYTADQLQNSGEKKGVSLPLADFELIETARGAKNGEAFWALYSGTTPGGPDRDRELCKQLAFWTNRDRARMDRLFRSSGQMHGGWDQTKDGKTYGAALIEWALGVVTDGYKPNGRRPARTT